MNRFARVLGLFFLVVTTGCAGATQATRDQPAEQRTNQAPADPAGTEPAGEAPAARGAAPAGDACPPDMVPVPAGAHCESCGPLDGCEASPATCRPACGTQADCASGGCNTQLGACVRLCG